MMVANAIIRQDCTKSELANYLHACAFSPALPTFQKAISNNNFVTWPAITSVNFHKFVTNKAAMYMGHLDQVRTNLQSTKNKPIMKIPPPHHRHLTTRLTRHFPKLFLSLQKNFLTEILPAHFPLSQQEEINTYTYCTTSIPMPS